jgi:hypothetical protein
MRFNKKQGRFLADAIDRWEQSGTIPADTADTLRGSYSVRPFDWGGLAKYSFLAAVVCAVIAFSAAAADDDIFDLLTEHPAATSAVSGILAALVFRAGYVRRKKCPEKTFSDEAILLGAVLLAATAVAFFGNALGLDAERASLLFLAASVLYGAIGITFPSKLVWLFALVSLGGWMGAETGYVSGWGAYFLGMSYPLRFAAFGAVLIAAAMLGMRSARAAVLRRTTHKFGLLCLFLSLWIMSIFGNYGDGDWSRADGSELFLWSAIFALAALAAVFHGLKRDDAASRGFGLTFLFINLYTKYFEYFWDAMPKALFFAILALSFWLVGRKAESIWNLEFLPKEKNK